MIGHGLSLATATFFESQSFDSRTFIPALWVLFLLYWLISAFRRKRTKRRESPWQRLTYVLPPVAAFYIVNRPEVRDLGLMSQRFVPDTAATQWIGTLLTAAGVAIAIWARVHLGTNWSGVVTLKEGHELIRTGPYRSIRHPIYTGILLGLFGTAVAVGEVRLLFAVAVVLVSFYFKARREESFLAQEFGPSFTEHQRHTGMFLPRFS